MLPEEYYGYETKDLTPGDFHVMEGTVDVKTDSLYDFARSYFKDVLAFEVNSAGPMTFMALDADSEDGTSAIGKDEVFYEARGLATRMRLASGDAEKLTRDLVYGNKACCNVAMVMSEQYNGKDGWNAAATADAVSDAFNPPGSATTLADERAEAEREQARRESLPVVHPSDVKFYAMATKPDGSPYVAGEDYIIAGSAQDTSVRPDSDMTPDDPSTKEDESGSGNEYYTVPTDEPDRLDTYVPPEPVDPNDANALRYNDDGSPAPTLGEQVEDAKEEPGVYDAYIEDGRVVRVYDTPDYSDMPNPSVAH